MVCPPGTVVVGSGDAASSSSPTSSAYLYVAGGAVACVGLGLYALRQKISSKWLRYRSDRRLDGKIVVVTGANAGLGYCAARDFASRGATVVFACRDQAKADKVIVFKKRRRHNYRRKNGHRQQHTILKIVSVGGQTAKSNEGDTAPAAQA